MRWEEIAAYIGGPAALLLLIQAGNNSLKEVTTRAPNAPDLTLPEQATLETTTLSLGADPANAATIGLVLMGLGALAAAAAIIFMLARRRTLATSFGRWNVLRYFTASRQTHNQTHKTGAFGNTGTATPSTLYYTTAIRLGALTAATDGTASPNELIALKRVFNLTEKTFPKADAIYAEQVRSGMPMSQVLKPFLAEYGKGSAVSETLIFGMTCVAMADGHMAQIELGLIRMAASLLGITPKHTTRILMSAGYFGASANAHAGTNSHSDSHSNSGAHAGAGRHQTQGNTARHAPLSEAERHLKTLGLAAGADKATIRKAWRNLATKYHPDKLVSQNLPPEAMEKAQDMMQTVNVAYDWLKDNPA